MTKEELEKEAEVCMHNALFWLKLPISKENVEQGGSYILKLLEPREKQIQIDAEQIRALQKQNGELTDKVKELEAQIEKMKNCRNCKRFMIEGVCGHFLQVGWCKNWELVD